MKASVILISLFSFVFSINTNESNNKESLSLDSFDDYKKEIDQYLLDSKAIINEQVIQGLRKNSYSSLDWLKTTYGIHSYNYKDYRKNKKINELYDQVSGQKDAAYSNLFWYSDINEAKGKSCELNKPILSLRMLGDFKDDFSCANSRFFRTLLYSNPEVAKVLREDFILHVSSVIDVPIITIKYPDGSVQKQTITGNSMHMIMDKEGNILDALPGLYGPDNFMNWLKNYNYPDFNKSSYIQKVNSYKKYHLTRLKTLIARDKDSVFVDHNLKEIISGLSEKVDINAFTAEPFAFGKSVVEAPVLKKLEIPQGGSLNPKSPSQTKFVSNWRNHLYNFGFVKETIHPNTISLIAAKKKYTDKELEKTKQSIVELTTTESIRNEVNLHVHILEWLFPGSEKIEETEFVEKVYATLFKTPLDDKKMGMYNKDLFYGLSDDGF